MATATAARPKSGLKESSFRWEGRTRDGKIVNGEMRATTETVVSNALRRQGVLGAKITRQRFKSSKRITEKDISLFTRQLATMLKAGIPMLQSFDIVGKGHTNPSVSRLLQDIKSDVEGGTALATAFRRYPLYFDDLYCNLVEAGEQAGILDTLLERIATYKEKMLAIKSKIKAALFYPIAILVVAFIVVAIIMWFVIPAFKDVFTSFGAELPAPTLFVVGLSDAFVENWYFIVGAAIGIPFWFFYAWRRSEKIQIFMDRFLLKTPLFGELIRKSVIARWNRTLSTMFSAGVPLVESLESVAGAAGNYVYKMATREIKKAVSTGTNLTVAVQNSNLFPNMAIQMIAIGEESGTLDAMLGKIADFFEAEVDDAVAALSSLMEPIIMVVLGVLIGGLVVAMYLPIFKLGGVV
ncbi:MAG: type II secretion system F family protein [Zoogloeaceae bacterium]|jgi:type IV pilus assembly protein PilC|nr:type II secretion system F family protein [Zoogloeaceae bacterium]